MQNSALYSAVPLTSNGEIQLASNIRGLISANSLTGSDVLAVKVVPQKGSSARSVLPDSVILGILVLDSSALISSIDIALMSGLVYNNTSSAPVSVTTVSC